MIRAEPADARELPGASRALQVVMAVGADGLRSIRTRSAAARRSSPAGCATAMGLDLAFAAARNSAVVPEVARHLGARDAALVLDARPSA
jgi:hypothetical protein